MAGITGWIESIASGISSISTTIVSLPSAICNLVVEGIKNLFIPEDGFIENTISEIQTAFNNLMGIDSTVLYNISSGETSLETLETSGSYLGYVVPKWVDTSFLIQGINTFRSTLRGFIIFLLILFNLNQSLMLFGAAPISMIGSIHHNAEKAKAGNSKKGD